MATQTDKLKIRLIQPSEDFADDAFNEVIKDIDNKVVGVSHLTSGAHWSVWKESTDYVVGDIVRTPYLKSNQYMECIVAGTSSTTSPTNNIQGSNITDNTVTWTIKTLGGASDSTVSFWKSNAQYYKGSLVVYNNKLYRSYLTHTSSTFSNDKANWFEVQSSINVWTANAYYAVGDTVVYEGNVYQCKTENTDATFTVANWDLLNSYGIVKDWSASTKYFKDQLISHDGAIYKVKSSYTSGNSFSDTNLSLVSSTIPTWSSDTYYPVGIIVQKDNVMYKCTSAHTSSNAFNTDLANWEIFHTPNAFVRDWQANTEYKAGQLVVVNGNLYRRTSDGYDTTWSTGFWELVTNAITDWSANTDYTRGQYVNYNGALYKCITSNTDATFTIAKWEKVSGGNLANWATGVDYVVNDTVIYADKLYQCTTAHTSTTFSADEANWKEISSYAIHIDDWVASTAYKAGDLVAYDAQIYRCKVAHTSASAFSTDDTKWEILSPTINIIKDWAVSTAYTLGQFVTHNNILYKCNTAHTSDSTSFDTDIAKWDKIGSSIDLWKANTPYRINDLVIYANKLYSCDINHTSANAIDLSKWTLIGDTGIKDWESTKAYKAGQLVLHDNVLYRIHDNHTSSAQITSDDAHLDFVWANIRPWEPNTYYKHGSIVKHNGCLYECLQSHTSGDIKTSSEYWVMLDKTIIEKYAQSKDYSKNTPVIYKNKLYIANTDILNSSATFDQTKWDEIGGYGLGGWQSSTKYSLGDIVIKDNQLYKCITAHTSSSVFNNDIANWDVLDTKWQSKNWATNTYYLKGEVVLYNNTPYKCITAHTSLGTFELDKADWEPLSANIREWVSGITYKVGDTVRYDGELYECTTATNASTFKKSCWKPICKCNISMWSASDDSTIALLHFNNPSNIYANECGDSFTKPSEASSIYSLSNSWRIGDSGYAMYNNSYQGIESPWYNLSSAEDIYTIEWWFYCTDVSSSSAVNFANIQYYNPTDNLTYNLTDYLGSDYSQTIAFRVRGTGISTMSVNTPYHIAVVLTNTTAKVFVNGTTIGTYTIDASKFRIYSVSDTNTFGHHYIDELRISNIARYTSDFTPLTEPFSTGNAWGYKKDDLVIYNDKIYRCITANNDAVFTPSKWVEVSKSEIPYWTNGNSYPVNSVVLYEDSLYKTTANIVNSTISPSQDMINWKKISSSGIDFWKANTQYEVEDIVMYNSAEEYNPDKEYTGGEIVKKGNTTYKVSSNPAVEYDLTSATMSSPTVTIEPGITATVSSVNLASFNNIFDSSLTTYTDINTFVEINIAFSSPVNIDLVSIYGGQQLNARYKIEYTDSSGNLVDVGYKHLYPEGTTSGNATYYSDYAWYNTVIAKDVSNIKLTVDYSNSSYGISRIYQIKLIKTANPLVLANDSAIDFYYCAVANNDNTFDVSKWQKIDVGGEETTIDYATNSDIDNLFD